MPPAELPTIDLNHPGFWADIHRPLAAALAVAPVARTPDGGLVIIGGAEVEQFLRDPRTVTVDLLERGGITDGPLHDWWSQVMFSTNPPTHTRLRRLVSHAFTPRRVASMSDVIEQICEQTLQPLRAEPSVDLVHDVAHHIPIRVLGSLLAIPDADYDSFADWTADLGLVFSSIVDPVLRERLERTVLALGEYVAALIDDRRHHAGSDLLSELIGVEEDGDRLSANELVALVMNLLFAGHDTTRSLLQIGCAVLIDHPHEIVAMRGDPAYVAAVVEEVLRYEPPVFGSARQPVTAIEIGGIEIAAGRPISVAVPAANRDPRRYAEPHRFAPARWRADPTPPSVLSFGQGIHYCLGAALARLEAQIALPRVFEAFPNLELVERPRWVPYAHIRRFEGLPVATTGSDAKHAPGSR